MSYRDRRLAERLEDPIFREEYIKARQQLRVPHFLTVEERKARREKNLLKSKNRSTHRKRNKHGRKGVKS